MSNIIEVRNLVKHYPGVTAVDNTSFGVARGCCFGLLGPNGAGKTTTLEIMEGLLTPSSGEVLYKGRPLDENFRQEAGIQFQTTALQDHLKVRHHLKLFHRLYRNTLPLEEVIDACALNNLLDRDARKLSGGQRQRLLLAIALLNDPEIIFLDEPTTGLDPQSRRNFWELIRKIKSQRKTIILTTHYMEEASQLCDWIAIMDHGRIIASGSPSSLLDIHFGNIILEIPRQDFHIDTHDLPFRVFSRTDSYEIPTDDVNGVLQHLLQQGVTLKNLQTRPRSLEDLFLELTGKDLRS